MPQPPIWAMGGGGGLGDIGNPSSLTTAQGTLHAKGAGTAGNGGKIETSGATLFTQALKVDASPGPLGSPGLWLIDPYDYVIGSTQAANISAALATASVTISTASNDANYGAMQTASAGSITLSSPISPTSIANNVVLTLDASDGTGGSIVLNQGISLPASGSVNLKAASVTGSGNIALTSGSLTVETTSTSPSDYTGSISGTTTNLLKKDLVSLRLQGSILLAEQQQSKQAL